FARRTLPSAARGASSAGGYRPARRAHALRRGIRSGASCAILAEFLVKRADLLEQLKRFLRFFLVDHVQRKTDVDDRVVAHLRLRHVGEARLFDHAAEVHAAHLQPGLLVNLDDLAWNTEAHDYSLPEFFSTVHAAIAA